ncbi:hypothetical protein RDI58_026345 [Solanum bulbocastanum]|uniref:Uncharacterized protein n=1 Tax=Solanum bulbocastanum TaxID=147425 RepID=A0AAN8Y120_SOLBU
MLISTVSIFTCQNSASSLAGAKSIITSQVLILYADDTLLLEVSMKLTLNSGQIYGLVMHARRTDSLLYSIAQQKGMAMWQIFTQILLHSKILESIILLKKG